MQKWLAVILISITLSSYFLLSGCISSFRAPQIINTTISPPISHQKKLSFFSMIENHTNMMLTIRPAENHQILITAPENLLEQIHYMVKGQQLYLDAPHFTDDQLAQIRVVITAPYLYQFNHQGHGDIYVSDIYAEQLFIISSGSGNVYLNNLHATTLSITNKSSGNVVIDGCVNIDKIVQLGQGHIKIGCLSSPTLCIYAAGSGMISLKGTVNIVDIVLTNSAHLDAKYLQIGSGYINAQGNSAAHIRMYDSQSVLVGQTGNVYYHDDPVHYAHYAAGLGSIIRMKAIEGCPNESFIKKPILIK